MPDLCKHYSCNSRFTIVVDDVGIKYLSMENDNHIIHYIQKLYQVELY